MGQVVKFPTRKRRKTPLPCPLDFQGRERIIYDLGFLWAKLENRRYSQFQMTLLQGARDQATFLAQEAGYTVSFEDTADPTRVVATFSFHTYKP